MEYLEEDQERRVEQADGGRAGGAARPQRQCWRRTSRIKLSGRAKAEAEGEFDDMSVDQLHEFIAAHTGHAPLGTLNRKTLMRMAIETHQPEQGRPA